MRPIKIMHVIDSLGIGGLENGVVNLINTMDGNMFEHAICCINRSGLNAERLERKSVSIFEMKKGGRSEWLLPLRLARLFRSFRPDIVHTRNWGAFDGIVGAWLARIPVIVHGEHGRSIGDHKGINPRRNLVRKWMSRLIDRYITVSKDFREWLITTVGINEEKVQNIYNGVDTDKFNSDNKNLMRDKYGYSDEDLVIGTVGRLDPVKDQKLLVKAFGLLNKKYDNIKLLIVGDGPCRENLEKLTEDLGLKQNVCLLGMRTDIPELLKLMDIFVLPSIIEGISNTILEAMATGIPILASNVGGNPELIVDGETGYLFQKENVNDLSTVLEQYIVDHETMMQHGAAGRERAINEFSLDRMIVQYGEMYKFLTAKI